MSKKDILIVNEGHYIEMSDRLHTVISIIEEFLLNHPVASMHPEIKKIIEQAQKALVNTYQLTGSLDARRNNVADELIETQKEYIKLLGDELDELALFVTVHGWSSTRADKGAELREKIKILSDKLK